MLSFESSAEDEVKKVCSSSVDWSSKLVENSFSFEIEVGIKVPVVVPLETNSEWRGGGMSVANDEVGW